MVPSELLCFLKSLIDFIEQGFKAQVFGTNIRVACSPETGGEVDFVFIMGKFMIFDIMTQTFTDMEGDF